MNVARNNFNHLFKVTPEEKKPKQNKKAFSLVLRAISDESVKKKEKKNKRRRRNKKRKKKEPVSWCVVHEWELHFSPVKSFLIVRESNLKVVEQLSPRGCLLSEGYGM